MKSSAHTSREKNRGEQEEKGGVPGVPESAAAAAAAASETVSHQRVAASASAAGVPLQPARCSLPPRSVRNRRFAPRSSTCEDLGTDKDFFSKMAATSSSVQFSSAPVYTEAKVSQVCRMRMRRIRA